MVLTWRQHGFVPLGAAALLGGAAQSLSGAAGALLAQDVAHSEVVAGLPQASLVAGAAIAAPIVGRLSTRIGRGAALSVGAMTAAVGCLVTVLGGFRSSLSVILLGSLLCGAGNAAVMLGRYAAADLVPHDRARAMGSFLLATTVGAVAGPNLLEPAGRFAGESELDPLMGSYLLASLGFLAAGCALLVVPDQRASQAGPAPIDARDHPSTPPMPLGAVGGPRLGLVVLALANFIMVAVMTMAPVHLHAHGASLALIGLVVSLHIAGMFLPSPLTARLCDKVGPKRLTDLAGATLLLACVMCGIGAGSVPAMLITGLVILGVGWNFALMAGSLMLTAGSPLKQRSRAEGRGEVAMAGAAFVGGAAAGPVVGLGGYVVLAVGGAVVTVPLMWAARSRPEFEVDRGPVGTSS